MGHLDLGTAEFEIGPGPIVVSFFGGGGGVAKFGGVGGASRLLRQLWSFLSLKLEIGDGLGPRA